MEQREGRKTHQALCHDYSRLGRVISGHKLIVSEGVGVGVAKGVRREGGCGEGEGEGRVWGGGKGGCGE